jgi:hypothetical protein
MTRVIRGSDLAKLALDRRLRHMPAQIGKQIASRNEAEKLVPVHDNSDAPANRRTAPAITGKGERMALANAG